MKIEHIVPALPTGGMEMVVSRLTQRLLKTGAEVGVTCIERGGPVADELRSMGVPVSIVRAPGLLTNLRAPALEKHLRARAPDVAHTHTGAWLKGAHAARRARIPRVVHTMHGLIDHEPSYGPWLRRQAARYTDHVVAVSKPLRSYLVGKAMIPEDKVLVIENGVDSELFSPARGDSPVRREWGFSPDTILVGMVARFSEGKNHQLLLRAFRKVTNRLASLGLILVGEGPLLGEMESLARDLGIAERVRFTGRMTYLPQVYRSLDVFVLSSRSEGTSMSILEAMATGLCVVATAVGGNPELLKDNCGLLTPSDDVDALADALFMILQDQEKRTLIGGRARERAITQFSELAVVKKYLSLYDGFSSRNL